MSKRTSKKRRPQAQTRSESTLDRLLPPNSPRRVAVSFLVLLALFLPPVLFSGQWSGWTPITHATAVAGGAGARLLDVDATVEGSLIRLPSRTLSVDPQCTAAALYAVYAALVLSYPVAWKKRLVALAVGLPVLFAVNVARLAGVALASESLPAEQFYITHDYLFEFGMIFAVMLMWVGWLSVAKRTT